MELSRTLGSRQRSSKNGQALLRRDTWTSRTKDKGIRPVVSLADRRRAQDPNHGLSNVPAGRSDPPIRSLAAVVRVRPGTPSRPGGRTMTRGEPGPGSLASSGLRLRPVRSVDPPARGPGPIAGRAGRHGDSRSRPVRVPVRRSVAGQAGTGAGTGRSVAPIGAGTPTPSRVPIRVKSRAAGAAGDGRQRAGGPRTPCGLTGGVSRAPDRPHSSATTGMEPGSTCGR